ncbi:MAG: Lrp/AsnC family transcriptional regulator [Syntrophorhabdaceae bacterium]|nr:Lrp/AsnC family transcriptional regulator [Syntrophorhabdaceae bacterium]MDD4196318.1 Lrp/AsnC family transcriptional regulator [Syntrophorhabdaceae bacterium]
MDNSIEYKMDATDRRLLDLLQEEFPLVERPFSEIGENMGLTDDEVKKRIEKLKAYGYIRRIGPVLDAKKLGYCSLLCAAAVKPDMIGQVAESVNAEPAVTHNYEREGSLNLWFTVTMKDQRDIDGFLKNIEDRFSIKIYRFPEKRTFKIKTHFITGPKG